ncbi:Mo-dependent nitrogenase C-terminal domain-containing protein [Mastigocoleus sp. MO_188.B34]|uniref:Mo-dependent nitrogenase C-terminal domain-containing protein n=1 Tax=Mastigocoleus sp. MO_188.B34 TaxID=3036635 RepID=UPI0026034630|nr:Mo-dependent nitrogenase C-terminal domain-containing protein [Mastigocoleus sp. MO_188.B34]MDJ0693562.1 Mo-dependent nitrogenase C-terminal domain-containing protein [Mastigocoleus sp. MO_188.B34]
MVNTNSQSINFSAYVQQLAPSDIKSAKKTSKSFRFNPLQPLRQFLDSLNIKNRKFAKLIAKLIPAQCPFERDIVIFGRKIGHIPPLCKLNPLYEELVCLRFRALCYLVDEYGEDIESYC